VLRVVDELRDLSVLDRGSVVIAGRKREGENRLSIVRTFLRHPATASRTVVTVVTLSEYKHLKETWLVVQFSSSILS